MTSSTTISEMDSKLKSNDRRVAKTKQCQVRVAKRTEKISAVSLGPITMTMAKKTKKMTMILKKTSRPSEKRRA